MSNRNRVAGIMHLQIDGRPVELAGTFTCDPGGVQREAVVGANGKVQGYSETTAAPLLEGEMRDSGKINLKRDIFSITDATITVTLANGKTYLYSEAFYVGDRKNNPEEGTVNLQFSAMDCEEMTP